MRLEPVLRGAERSNAIGRDLEMPQRPVEYDLVRAAILWRVLGFDQRDLAEVRTAVAMHHCQHGTKRVQYRLGSNRRSPHDIFQGPAANILSQSDVRRIVATTLIHDVDRGCTHTQRLQPRLTG